MRKAKGQMGKERSKRDRQKQRQYKFDEDRFRDDMSRALQGTGRKDMFNLTMHSTHFIYSYMASDIWCRTIQIVRGNPLLPHGLLFPIICTIPQTGEHIPQPLLHQSWSTGWNEK